MTLSGIRTDCVVIVASRFIGEFVFGLSDETPINGHATKSPKMTKNAIATHSGKHVSSFPRKNNFMDSGFRRNDDIKEKNNV